MRQEAQVDYLVCSKQRIEPMTKSACSFARRDQPEIVVCMFVPGDNSLNGEAMTVINTVASHK